MIDELDNPTIQIPLARKSDPTSSKEAAGEINDDGLVVTEARQCLSLVRRYPGHTALELAHLSNGALDRYQLNRRLPWLRDSAMLIDNGESTDRVGKRVCQRSEKGLRAQLWYPVKGKE